MRLHRSHSVTGCYDPPFSGEELRQAVDELPNGKATGPDLVPSEVIKLAARHNPERFLETFNACLNRGVFPSRLKRARLVLIYKGEDKPLELHSSYRQIYLLDGASKFLKRMLLNRVERHEEVVAALRNFLFGFRRARSTVDAIEEVLSIAQAAGAEPVQSRDLCAFVTLDVQNAFNTVPWTLIDAAL